MKAVVSRASVIEFITLNPLEDEAAPSDIVK
jgi:hypothetical protein